MKQFNLEEYLKNPNRKVVTRDGRDVKILCTDRNDEYSIVALVATQDGKEQVYCYLPNGRHYRAGEDSRDLMFILIKKEGWINLFKINSTITTGEVYNTEEEAKSAVVGSSIYISTVKVEWEE